MRRARVQFLSAVVSPHILEVGGGRGGDLGVWARHPVVRLVDVVDPDPVALHEYARRLRVTYHGEGDDLHMRLPDGRLFRFHVARAEDLSDLPGVGQGSQLAVLSFSASQIITSTSKAALVWRVLLGRVHRIAITAHDHLVAGLPDPDHPHGVTCRVVHPTGCSTHPIVCVCSDGDGQAARLHTRIVGSTMADGITENAFSVAAHILAPAKQLGALVRLERACSGDSVRHHWLLRSLVFATIDRAEG